MGLCFVAACVCGTNSPTLWDDLASVQRCNALPVRVRRIKPCLIRFEGLSEEVLKRSQVPSFTVAPIFNLALRIVVMGSREYGFLVSGYDRVAWSITKWSTRGYCY